VKRVVHLLGPSHGGIRRHVRFLAEHPPPGYATGGVLGPPELGPSFPGVGFRPLSRTAFPSVPRDADLLHAHGLTVGSVAFRRRRPPVVLTMHMDVPVQGRTAAAPWLRTLAPFVVRRADAVIAVSDKIRTLAPGSHSIPPAVAPLPAPSRPREDVRAELGAPPDAVVLLALARLHPDKALDVLIDATREAGVVVWIAGEGPDRGRLERLARGTPVQLLGHREDPADLLAAADALAMPSVGEGYPIAVVEAVTARIPVLATRAGAIAEIVGDAGLLIDVGDRLGFAEAVRSFAADPALRERLTERAAARSLPSPEELVRRVGAVYDDVTR
jgi:glycosyltransferase involved in cell wall biosynthesis